MQAPIIYKSPIRYPGGKTRGVKQIIRYIPRTVKKICSPFLGGGSIELTLARSGIKIFGYDSFEPLTNFWQVLLKDSKKLAHSVIRYYPLTKPKFHTIKKTYFKNPNKVVQAAKFFSLNRASFSGATFSGGMSIKHPRFTLKAIQYLKYFKAKNLIVRHADFNSSIPSHSQDFLYLDPPYYLKSRLYGSTSALQTQFDHESLCRLLRARNRWILSYNDCGKVRKLYKGYTRVRLKWSYGMNKSKRSNELLILSQDVAKHFQKNKVEKTK